VLQGILGHGNDSSPEHAALGGTHWDSAPTTFWARHVLYSAELTTMPGCPTHFIRPIADEAASCLTRNWVDVFPKGQCFSRGCWQMLYPRPHSWLTSLTPYESKYGQDKNSSWSIVCRVSSHLNRVPLGGLYWSRSR
jgi:hypothetical protein